MSDHGNHPQTIVILGFVTLCGSGACATAFDASPTTGVDETGQAASGGQDDGSGGVGQASNGGRGGTDAGVADPAADAGQGAGGTAPVAGGAGGGVTPGGGGASGSASGGAFGGSESSGGAGETLLVPTCYDGLHNGAETDVDCGGDTCPECANTKACSADDDCMSAYCARGICEQLLSSNLICAADYSTEYHTEGGPTQNDSGLDAGSSCTSKLAIKVVPGQYLTYANVDFGTGAGTLHVGARATFAGGGTLTVRAGNASGPLVASVPVTNDTWQNLSSPVSGSSPTGIVDLHVELGPGDGPWMELVYLSFEP
jgi:hypothetical protein